MSQNNAIDAVPNEIGWGSVGLMPCPILMSAPDRLAVNTDRMVSVLRMMPVSFPVPMRFGMSIVIAVTVPMPIGSVLRAVPMPVSIMIVPDGIPIIV